MHLDTVLCDNGVNPLNHEGDFNAYFEAFGVIKFVYMYAFDMRRQKRIKK